MLVSVRVVGNVLSFINPTNEKTNTNLSCNYKVNCIFYVFFIIENEMDGTLCQCMLLVCGTALHQLSIGDTN